MTPTTIVSKLSLCTLSVVKVKNKNKNQMVINMDDGDMIEATKNFKP